MNNTVNVSIAGVAFILDGEGYRLLKDYLVRIEVGYRNNPDGQEILSDIEARISELILNEQAAETVVPAGRLRDIIDQLGLPDGLDPDTAAEEPAEPSAGMSENFARRLYRNPDGAKLGGVCSGLGTFFRVDPTLMRLLFFAPLLILIVISVIPGVNMLCGFFGALFGACFLLYLILWFAIPKAKTPRQRLEMAGERITASSIHRNLSEDLNTAKPSPRNERTASVFSELLYVVGRVLLFCVKAFVLFVGIVLAFVAIGLIIGLIALLVGGHVAGLPFALTSGHMLLTFILAMLLLILPIVIVVYLLLKLVFNLPSRRTTMSVLFGVWMLILIYIGVYSVKNFEQIRDAVEKGNIEMLFTSTSYTVPLPAPQIITDSVRVETVSVGDSTVTDTVHVEYFTE